MYQAKIIASPLPEAGSFKVDNFSTGDEVPVDRVLYLRDGYGKLITEYYTGILSSIRVDNYHKSTAFTIEYLASVNTPEFGSVYSDRIVYVHTSPAEDLLLRLQGDLYCKSSCNPSKEKFIHDSSVKIIELLEAAGYYAKKCDVGNAQRMLDYINEIGITSSNCGCGCS
jgi:hypothetical protein